MDARPVTRWERILIRSRNRACVTRVLGLLPLMAVVLALLLAGCSGSAFRDEPSYEFGLQRGQSNPARSFYAGGYEAERACKVDLDIMLELPSSQHMNRDDVMQGCIDALEG